MSINEIIVYIMVLFMALGALDRIIGNKFGLGEKFEEGILAMGSLALAMIGIICLAPVLANLLRPVVPTRPCAPGPYWQTIWAARPWPESWRSPRRRGSSAD